MAAIPTGYGIEDARGSSCPEAGSRRGLHAGAPLLPVVAMGLFLLCVAGPLRADDGASRQVDIKGMIKVFCSVFTEENTRDEIDPHDDLDYNVNRGEFHLELSGYIADKVSYKTHAAFTYGMETRLDGLEDLETGEAGRTRERDVETELKAASFTIMDIGTPGLDLTVGRQRVRWGTSDEYNVIDNLNPVDYGTMFTFDPDYFVAHLPMDGFNLEYRLPTETELKLQAVYLLSFKPSSLPRGFTERIRSVMQDELEEQSSPYGFPVGTAQVVLGETPEYSLGKGTAGVRVSGNMFNMDWGVSYYHGYVSLPVVHSITSDITLVQGTTLQALMDYPRLDVVGFDLAGEVTSVGIWAEAGCYWPEDYLVRESTRLMSTTRTTEVRLFDRPYWKYTVGFDYTFGIGNGLYWNTQFNHGFYDEFRYTPEARRELGLGGPGFMGDIEDYLASRLEYSFFNDELTCVLDVLLEMPRKSDINGYSAVVGKPKVIYKPYDNVSLELAYVLITGDGRTKYGAYEKNDVAYLLLKAHF